MAIANTVNLIALILVLSIGMFSVMINTCFYQKRKELSFTILEKMPLFNLRYLIGILFFIFILLAAVALVCEWSNILLQQMFLLPTTIAALTTTFVTQDKIPECKTATDKKYIALEIFLSSLSFISGATSVLVFTNLQGMYSSALIPKIGTFELLLPALIIAELLSWLWFPVEKYSLALRFLPVSVNKYLFSRMSQTQYIKYRYDLLKIAKDKNGVSKKVNQCITPTFKHMVVDTIDKEIIELYLKTEASVMHVMPHASPKMQAYLLTKLH